MLGGRPEGTRPRKAFWGCGGVWAPAGYLKDREASPPGESAARGPPAAPPMTGGEVFMNAADPRGGQPARAPRPSPEMELGGFGGALARGQTELNPPVTPFLPKCGRRALTNTFGRSQRV